MKRSFNTVRLSRSFALAFFVMAATTQAAGAETTSPPTTPKTETTRPSATSQAEKAVQTQTVCDRVGTFGAEALTNAASRAGKVNTDKAADAAKRQQQLQTFDAKIAADRTHWDEVRNQNFAKLTADAKTEAQKQAVTTFQQTVLAAVATRRAAVDAARDTFRSGLIQDVSGRQAQITQAVTAFTAAINAAIAAAKASCASGTNASDIRSTFTAALKTARQNLQAAIAAAPKAKTNASQLAASRNAAVKAADAAFQATLKQAVATLKAALGQA